MKNIPKNIDNTENKMRSDTNYLFLGGLFPKEMEKEIFLNSTGAVQNAANAFQWNIINGFDQNLTKPIKIINSLYIGSYPRRYRKLIIPTFKFEHIENAEDVNVGFCNFMGYKNISRKRSLFKAAKEWINNTPGKKCVFAYAMTNIMVSVLYSIKRIDPSIKTCLIVPDLPEYMNTSLKKNMLYGMLKKIDIKNQNTKLHNIDMFVYLTKQMDERIKAKKYVVIEGISNDIFKTLSFDKKMNKTILYTGGLNEKYGVKNLVDAFMSIKDKDYKLIICGSGDLEQYIKEAQNKDSRIDFRGVLLHDEVLSLQMQATVLVNPRQNNEEFTKYSFPSKNLEYLASGTPVISYKLDGIPDEYDEYLIYVLDNSIVSLRKKIEEVCSLTEEERKNIGAKCRDFVLKEKNSKKQIKKVIDSIESI